MTAETYPAELVWRPLIESTVDHYWPVLSLAAIYLLFLVTAFVTTDHGVLQKTLLATGAPWIVNLWGITTVFAIIVTAESHAFPHAEVFVRVGYEATLCLFPILCLLVPVNLLCRRIGMPTAFTLSVGAAVAAVYADLIAVMWLATSF